VPLTSKKGKDKTPSLLGKKKAIGSSINWKEKTPGKELNRADSGSSSIKGKEKTHCKELNRVDSGSSSIKGKEKTHCKELNQANSGSSSIKGKKQAPKKEKKVPTPGTCQSPCTQAALSTSVSSSESSAPILSAGVSQPEKLDFSVDGASPDDDNAAVEDNNVEDEDAYRCILLCNQGLLY
jgi:hypothetical protein